MKLALWFLAAALSLAAQPKLLVNAQVDTRAAAGGLDRVFRELTAAQPQPAWIGYSVPATRGYNLGCEYVRGDLQTAGVVHLEPPADALILYRVEANAVTRIRPTSPDCEIDAGGLGVHWITGVDPAQSVALLASFVGGHDRVGDSAISAIAVHAGPAADQAIDRYAAPGQPEAVRQRAVSAMAHRGPHGFEILKKLATSDPEPRVRAQAVGALARNPAPETADILAGIAGSDPDRDVRHRAISSLYALPDGQGVPALIRIAKNARDPEIRRQSMSSLAQSRDPRAIALFEEILK